tara:strand:- start:174 stop:461 length:288 start_codon:yes stop_codon:yes gene_type:complete
MNKYHDQEGNPITLYKLVRKEPDWAASRIEFMNNKIAELEAARFKLLDCMLGISDACIGEITMSYKLDAEHIGQWIYEATGKTNPELTKIIKDNK